MSRYLFCTLFTLGLVGCTTDATTPSVRVYAFRGESFSAIWGSDDDDVWALGVEVDADAGSPVAESFADIPCNVGQPALQKAYVLRHFDGTSWTREPLTGPQLGGLAGSGADDVWAFGVGGIMARSSTSTVPTGAR